LITTYSLITAWNRTSLHYIARTSDFRFNFEQTESQIDIDALAARYDDPDFWNRAVIEAPGDSLA
jgi:hypothetical protein